MLAVVSGGASYYSELPCVRPVLLHSFIFGGIATAAPPTLGGVWETIAGICQRTRHQGNRRLFALIAIASPLILLVEDG